MNSHNPKNTTPRSASLIAFLFIMAALIMGMSVTIARDFVPKNIQFAPQLIAALLGFLSWNYVKDVIEEAISSDILKTKNEEIQQKEASDIQKKQEREFLSRIQDTLDSDQAISFLAQSSSLHLKEEFKVSTEEFKEKLKKIMKRSNACLEAVNGLSEDDKKQNDSPLMLIVATAVNRVLKRKPNSEILNNNEKIYEDLYLYLKAWLICSIKYDTAMSIEPLRIKDENKKYRIKALRYIKDVILKDKEAEINDILPSEEAKEIVDEYLGILIEGLEKF